MILKLMQAENWVWTLKILIHFLHGQRTTQTMHFYCLNLTNILSIWKAQVKYHRVLLEIWCRFFNSKSNRCWKQSIDSYLLARILCKSRNYFWSLKFKVHSDGLVGDFMMVTNFNIRHQHQCSHFCRPLPSNWYGKWPPYLLHSDSHDFMSFPRDKILNLKLKNVRMNLSIVKFLSVAKKIKIEIRNGGKYFI